MEKKDLFLVIDYVDLSSVLHLLKGQDCLAMTPGAMLALKEKNINYLTFEDFYNFKRFRIDNEALMKETENLFRDLDKIYEPILCFPRAYTGSIYQFLIAFADVLYLSKIIKEVSISYGRTYLISSKSLQSQFDSDKESCVDGISFNNPTVGFNNKVKLFRDRVTGAYWLPNKEVQYFNFVNYKSKLAGLLKCIYGKIINLKQLIRKDSVIFIVQDGFEVGFVKRYFKGASFVNTINVALKTVGKRAKQKINSDFVFPPKLNEFIKKWFPGFENYVSSLFMHYHKQLTDCVFPLFLSIENMFNIFKPAALFFSMGSFNISEDICAYIANKKNIPVFYFQHGGAQVFFHHPFQKYLERNDNIDKINILHSRVEESLIVENHINKSKSKALGSIKFYYLHKGFSGNHTVKNNSVLYCTSTSPFYGFKDLMTSIPDADTFKIQSDIIKVIQRFNLKLTIKITPGDQDRSFIYYKNLAHDNMADIRVLKGIPAEKIIPRHGLLILDNISSSSMVGMAIISKLPVILYLGDDSFLRKETIADIEERFYIARNSKELENCIRLYSSGQLKSKANSDTIDRYSFPINEGNPAINITRYIKEVINGNSK